MATKVSQEANEQIKQLWITYGEAKVLELYDKIIETLAIVEKDTKNMLASLAVSTLSALRPVVVQLADLIDGISGNIEENK